MSRLFLYSWQIQGDHINLYPPPGKTTMGRLENHHFFNRRYIFKSYGTRFSRQSCSFSRAGGTSYWNFIFPLGWISWIYSHFSLGLGFFSEAKRWVEGGRQPIQDGWFRIGFCIVRGRFLAGFLLRSVVSLVNFSHGSACQTPLKPFRCHASLTWDISFEN